MALYLLDTNILLRCCDPSSPGYAPAIRAVETLLSRGDNLYITAQNLIEFWAVVTRPLAVNGFGWPPQDAALQVEQLLDLFPLLEETPAIFQDWLQLVTARSIVGKQVHDARLVAVMQAHDIHNLLTFDVDDFKPYSHITLVHPGSVT